MNCFLSSMYYCLADNEIVLEPEYAPSVTKP